MQWGRVGRHQGRRRHGHPLLACGGSGSHGGARHAGGGGGQVHEACQVLRLQLGGPRDADPHGLVEEEAADARGVGGVGQEDDEDLQEVHEARHPRAACQRHPQAHGGGEEAVGLGAGAPAQAELLERLEDAQVLLQLELPEQRLAVGEQRADGAPEHLELGSRAAAELLLAVERPEEVGHALRLDLLPELPLPAQTLGNRGEELVVAHAQPCESPEGNRELLGLESGQDLEGLVADVLENGEPRACVRRREAPHQVGDVHRVYRPRPGPAREVLDDLAESAGLVLLRGHQAPHEQGKVRPREQRQVTRDVGARRAEEKLVRDLGLREGPKQVRELEGLEGAEVGYGELRDEAEHVLHAQVGHLERRVDPGHRGPAARQRRCPLRRPDARVARRRLLELQRQLLLDPRVEGGEALVAHADDLVPLPREAREAVHHRAEVHEIHAVLHHHGNVQEAVDVAAVRRLAEDRVDDLCALRDAAPRVAVHHIRIAVLPASVHGPAEGAPSSVRTARCRHCC
mmetsp:Transcript_29812/g.83956  ORF Transcript_29812/g.83956 Transcript_29812/m.83956 type:complete len:516 (-) Transcript_29812:36-1583(-)